MRLSRCVRTEDGSMPERYVADVLSLLLYREAVKEEEETMDVKK